MMLTRCLHDANSALRTDQPIQAYDLGVHHACVCATCMGKCTDLVSLVPFDNCHRGKRGGRQLPYVPLGYRAPWLPCPLVTHIMPPANHTPSHRSLFRNRATSGFEICFCYRIPAPLVPGPNGPNRNRITDADNIVFIIQALVCLGRERGLPSKGPRGESWYRALGGF